MMFHHCSCESRNFIDDFCNEQGIAISCGWRFSLYTSKEFLVVDLRIMASPKHYV